MNLLTQDFNTITFNDVVVFCDQKIVESTELDYKKVIPRDLAKHVAAMANRYGGLIIIGVEEDPSTGTPGAYEGMANDGKLIERINQVANNVRPLPSYAVRTAAEVNGKVFLLLRVHEGDAPPYTTVNDPTVYLRTGNVTTPLRQADADIVRDLYAKRATATPLRAQNVSRADDVLKAAIAQQDAKRIEQLMRERETGQIRVLEQSLSENLKPLNGYLQPFFPQRELALPRAILEKLVNLRVVSNYDTGFPSPNMEPITRGLLSFEWTMRDVSFTSDQIYANGFFCHVRNTIGPQRAGQIFLSDIARLFYVTLLFGRKFYGEVGYSGLVRGGIDLERARGRSVRYIVPQNYTDNYAETPVTIDDKYHWAIEADTHQLSDDAWVRQYFTAQMREIYWDLGYPDVPEGVLDAFIEEWAFR